MIGDYEDIATRAFTEPYLAELRALVRVCADHFESAGDPRGTLISLAEERYDATSRRGYELQRAIDEHVIAHHAAELGDAALLLLKPRTCMLEWRCGRLYAARLDARHAPENAPLPMVRALLDAPAAATLRRLTIRARNDDAVRDVYDLVASHHTRPPLLEALLVLREVRPRRIAGLAPTELVVQYPALYLFAQRDEIQALSPTDLPTADNKLIGRLQATTTPLDDDDRTLLGRALTSTVPAIRAAALERVAELGDHAAVFVDLLALLLQPGLAPALPIIECLRAMGPAAERALPALVKVPGRTKHYDRDTRQAAGRLIARLRPHRAAPSA